MEAGAIPNPTLCIFVLTRDVQPHYSGLILKFLKACCPASMAFFEHDGVVSVAKARKIFISDVYSQITSAAAEDPVNDMAEESRSQYAPSMDTGYFEENVR